MISGYSKHCVVVTCFDKNQPGFLDFSYRIGSLAKEYQLTIISQVDLTQAELRFEQAAYKVFSVGHGKLGWMCYVLKCANFIRLRKPNVVVLLHSAAAPIALIIGSIPSCLYWNEHPSNLVRLPSKFAPFRYMLALMFQRLVFIGAKKTNIIMPIGEELLEDLYKQGINSDNIKMLYMGVSDNFALKVGIKVTDVNQSLRLIYIGTVSKARGRDVMLEAMAILAKENIAAHLSIIGASEEQLNFCMQHINGLDIQDSVTVKGRVPGNQIPKYLAQADIGICLWEKSAWVEFNPPTKLFEYLVAGVPVLASNIRTHTRYVRDWHNGVIFDYDASSLAKTIIKLHNQKDKIDALKKQTTHSGQEYLWSKLEPKFLAVVRKLAVP
jgi:glycosyltransferase involved in cell wall biosynthesis